MRKFSSYGAVSKSLHYYVPREELIQRAYTQLIGESPDEEGGHYITVWAPRQCGKTWIMREVLWSLMSDDRFRVMKLNLEHLKMAEDTDDIVSTIAGQITEKVGLRNIRISRLKEFEQIFKKGMLDKPLILIHADGDCKIPIPCVVCGSELQNLDANCIVSFNFGENIECQKDTQAKN